MSERTHFEPAPHYLDHRQRLRARFLDGGADAMPDYEILELVLFAAIPRRDVKPLAKTLIAHFGNFAEVDRRAHRPACWKSMAWAKAWPRI